ncbi:fungal-specific transcription factor domain-containing protein [Penicillium malachiteum]|uniref:fungal-specific transcription factor domain-containing protein n=1 Tax=Penicillium malachiteum TaxID=1324776 RepID=UPI002547789E|nr:fungal-specific transcription factor domain-containing protein [Penicillium malachiteum]KAJ5734898.1 fungal-specific transcription factor domain-containing protein [Penicillium malachiteum]
MQLAQLPNILRGQRAPKGGASAGQKRKRTIAKTANQADGEGDERRFGGGRRIREDEEEEERSPEVPAAVTSEEQHTTPIFHPPAVPPQISSIPTTGSELAHPIEMGPEFDQYAHDLGLVLATFWGSHPNISASLDSLDGAGDLSDVVYNHLPTSRLSGSGLSPSSFHLDLGSAGHLENYGPQSHSKPINHPLPPRSAHEFYIKNTPLDSKFIGMGSVGSTIFESLRHSSSQGRSMESKILNHLVRGIQHVDEVSVLTPFRAPPLPQREFAEQGVKAYYDFVHLLYPLVEGEFFRCWHQLYESPGTISAAIYSRFCLVVSIGSLTSPLHSNTQTWETAKILQEQIWSLNDQVMAVPFMESAQVMLLHTVFFLTCGKTGIAWVTCGMAIRITQSLGLHQKTPPQLGLNAENILLRSRLWSVAYTLDAFLSLSEGRPPATTSPPNLELSQSISEHGSSILAIDRPDSYIHDWDIGLAMIANEVHLLLRDSGSPIGALSRITRLIVPIALSSCFLRPKLINSIMKSTRIIGQ